MLRLWINNGERLPWHIDLDLNQLRFYPDIHIHIGGRGMKVASPKRPLKLLFSDRKVSPQLQMAGLSLLDMHCKNPEKAMQQKLSGYLHEHGVDVMSLEPGQALFFNEKCLHASASSKAQRMRAGIF